MPTKKTTTKAAAVKDSVTDTVLETKQSVSSAAADKIVEEKKPEEVKVPVETKHPSGALEGKKSEQADPAASVKSPEAKKSVTPRKTAANKKTPAPKKAAPKKTSEDKSIVDQNVYVQFGGREILAKDILDRVKALWTAELGKKEKDLKEIKLYIKPEEYAAYYVINDDITGSIDL